MAYSLIPEGFTLKKVTKAEKDAVDEYFGREIKGGYLQSFLGNTSTPGLIGSVGLLTVTTILIDSILKALQEQGKCPKLTPGEEAEIKKELQRQLLEISPITRGLGTLEEALGRLGFVPGALA